jgi:two-component system, OmpR family, sensor histidine kinase KdpD
MHQRTAISLIRRYGSAILVTAAITAGILVVDPTLGTVTIAMLYLLGVLFVATTAGLGPGIVTSVLCLLTFNFFFVAPRYTFHVEDPQNVVHLLTFLAVAVVASTLAARARTAAERAQRQAMVSAALYQLSQTISAQVDLDRILPAIAETVCQLLPVPFCAISVYNEAGQLIERTHIGTSAPTLQTIQIPIREGAIVLGVLRVVERTPGTGLGEADRQLLNTLAAQTRLAIDRVRLVEQMAHNQALGESDRLKSALLASVSHDLRTPLAIMKGATSTLLAEDVAWDGATQRALTQTLDLEIDHLNRVVGNLLDLSRIEAGTLPAERDWHDIAEVIGAALQHLEHRLSDRPVHVDVASDLPLVLINPVLIGQVITNLLENALKYAPPDRPIVIAAHRADATIDSGVLVTVRDYGPGIPSEQLGRIFEKFYRYSTGSDRAGGAGLGLAICKGLVEAHGGRIWAQNCPDRGARFSFTLPQPHTSADSPQPQGSFHTGEQGVSAALGVGNVDGDKVKARPV